MKVTYNWLKEFVDIKVSPEKLAEKLTMAGLSVATFEKTGADWVYDIEVTSNRPDWLSVRGIAREVAAMTNAKLKGLQAKVKKITPSAAVGLEPLSVRVEEQKDCRVYYGNLIAGVKVGPSPEGLRKRLEALGLRSVNNVVDITNYCLLEYGQPLHAFDHDRLEAGAIVVRRAQPGESLVLIDGLEKKLVNQVLVVADSEKPVAIAGIMGGRETEVSDATFNVMLESAAFDPVVIRRGTRILGVSSDSSYRFERGVDLKTVKDALDAATGMILDLCGGKLVDSRQAGTVRPEKPRVIDLDLRETCDVLSLDVSAKDAKEILRKLGFGVKEKGRGRFLVAVPDFRRDVRIKEDLTEEIARSYGYEKIPLTSLEIKPCSLATPKVRELVPVVRSLLARMGLKEAVTYSLVSEEDYAKSGLGFPSESFILENPLSRDYCALRGSLVPSLLACASSNAAHNNADLEIFEIAPVFTARGEEVLLGILLSGQKRATWKNEAKGYTLFDIKGILEALIDELGILTASFSASEENWLENRAMVGAAPAASFAQVPERVKKAWGIKTKEDIFVAEVFLRPLAQHARGQRHFVPYASAPSITRDISALAQDAASFSAIKALVEQKAKGLLKKIELVECYQGKEIPQGARGLTISLEYGSAAKTLSDEEINPVHQGVLDSLVKELGLVIR